MRASKFIVYALDFLLYYLSWLGAANSYKYEYAGLVSFGCLLPYLLFNLWQTECRRKAFIFIFAITALGLQMDGLLSWLNVFVFSKPNIFLSPFPPVWYWPIWIGLAIWLTSNAQYFSNKKIINAILGAVFVPISFQAGQKMGAIHIQKPIWVISAMWFFIFPTLVTLTKAYVFKKPLP